MDEENWRHDAITRLLLLAAAAALITRGVDTLFLEALSSQVRVGLLVGAFAFIGVTVVKMRMNAQSESD